VVRLDPLWRKAPFAMRRYPGLFASLTLGALLLSLAAVALPIFVSATTSDLLRRQVDAAGVSRYGAGMEYHTTPLRFDTRAGTGEEPLYDRLADVFAREAARSPVLGGTVEGVMGSVIDVMPQGGSAELREGRLFAGTDAGVHVEMLAGTADDGVTMPDLIADALGVGVGDAVTLTGRGGRTATVVVGGIYRGLYAKPTPGYWQPWDDQIHNITCTDCAPLPQFILVARDQLIRLERQLGRGAADFTWRAPLATSSITLQEALLLRSFAADFRTAISDPGSELGALFHCCVEQVVFAQGEIAFRTYMPKVIDAVDARVAAIEAPGRILRTAGLLVASLVVAAAGMFAFGARRPESRLLHARGVRPIVVAVRGAVEAVVPCVIGGSIGVGLGALLVIVLGPDGAVAADVWPVAFRNAAVAILAAVLLLGLIATIAYLGSGERASSDVSLRWIPWELPLLAVGWLELDHLRLAGALTPGSGGVDRPSSLVLAVPILLLAGALGVGVRLFRWAAAWLRGRSGRYGSASFLAVHRLAAAPALTAALFVASGMCLGVFVEGQTLVRSLQTTVEAKAKIFVGSDVQARIDRDTEPIGRLPVPVTRVTRLAQAGTLDPGGREFDLLAIDPATFASAAFWNDRFADEPLSALVDRLDDASATSLSVVVVGDVSNPVTLTMQQEQIPVTVVARASAFPGAASLRPLVVVDAAAIEGWPSLGAASLAQARASTELWGRGDTGEVIDAFSTLDLPPFQVVTAAETMDIPSIAAVVNTFLALNALGLGAAVLVVGALLMYLQSRERSRMVAHGLSLRMGMTDLIHRRSMLIETTSLLTSSYAVGLAMALVVAVATVPLLDPLTAVRPAPLVVLPTLPMLFTFAGLALASWLACLVADVRSRHVPMGEVMRTAE
jgi:putative ABC transport system permease protein